MMIKNTILILILVISHFIAFMQNSLAMGVFLDTTRIIFPLDSKDKSIQLRNTNPFPVLIEMWLDNGNIEQDINTIDTPLVIIPPLMRMEANESKFIRLIKVKAPENKKTETVLWFNILEIPPDARNQTENRVNITITNRMKVFLRPKHLIKGGSDNWINHLQCKLIQAKTVRCKNPTNYYATIAKIYSSNASGYFETAGDMIPPHGELTFTLENVSSTSKPKSQGTWVTVIGDNGYHSDKKIAQ